MSDGNNLGRKKDLEKRSLNGAYAYLPTWILISLGASEGQTFNPVFWEVSSVLLVLGVLRLICYKYSDPIMARSPHLWWYLFLCNSLIPIAIFGATLAASMVYAEYASMYIYLLMTLAALLSGGTVSFSTHRGLANAYLLAGTVPALLCIALLAVNRSIEGAMFLIYLVFMFFQIKRLNQEYNLRFEQRLELENLTRIDSLTGIYNRRYFDEALKLYWKSHLRLQQPLGLLLIDIDHFKKVNDHYGHPAGDEVIREVANVIEQAFPRETDVVARIGGEEYAVLISQATLNFMETRAETIRHKIEDKPVVFEGHTIPMTVSIGAVMMQPQASMTRSEFYQAADNCLYQAKQQGRNQVISESRLLTIGELASSRKSAEC